MKAMTAFTQGLDTTTWCAGVIETIRIQRQLRNAAFLRHTPSADITSIVCHTGPARSWVTAMCLASALAIKYVHDLLQPAA